MKNHKQFMPGTMHLVVPTGKHGEAEIVHESPDRFTRLHGAIHGQPLECNKYTRLVIGGTLWMTDAEFEWRTSLTAVRKMRGDVLIIGLGIGFILSPIYRRRDISSVTVIEKSADVILLVAPCFPGVTVIEADAYKWTPPKCAFDVIYFDIWPNIPNADDWADIKKLKRKYRSALRTGGWIAAWCEDYARR